MAGHAIEYFTGCLFDRQGYPHSQSLQLIVMQRVIPCSARKSYDSLLESTHQTEPRIRMPHTTQRAPM